jgi:dolichol kinase
MTGTRQEPRRNLIHAATGFAAPWVLWTPAPWLWLGLGAMLLVPLALDVFRWSGGRDRIERLLPGVYRDREPLGVSGATLLACGYLLAVLLFPRPAAAGGIIALAVGDPAAAVAGRWYGARRGRGGKTWVGSLACFAACIPPLWLLPGLGLPAAAAAGAMAALVERRAGPLDNVLLPVAVAMLLGLWFP